MGKAGKVAGMRSAIRQPRQPRSEPHERERESAGLEPEAAKKPIARGTATEHTLGFLLAPHDGMVSYWREPSSPARFDHCPTVFCTRCGSPIAPDAVSSRRLRLRNWDLLATHDGHIIVNDRFKRFCEDRQYRDIDFVPVVANRPAYDLRPRRILALDWKRSKPLGSRTRCRRCRQPMEVLINSRAGVHFRNALRPLPDGIWRSDVLFGGGSEKAPLFVVGVETARAMAKAGFRAPTFFSLPDFRLCRRLD